MTAHPAAGDYYKAVQAPTQCFTVPKLQAAEFVWDSLGPVLCRGRSAVVFRASVGGSQQALRCSIKEDAFSRVRYSALDAYLAEHDLSPYVARTTWLDDAIKVNKATWPVLTTDWIDGRILNEHVDFLVASSNAAALTTLAANWRELVALLQRNEFGHGDLAHGNVMVDQESSLRLVDFDGVWVPRLAAGPPASEFGHPNYQHPELRQWNRWVDTFSALVIYLSLVALGKDPGLWLALYNSKNLLFAKNDFFPPFRTEAWNQLAALGDPQVDELCRCLQECCARGWVATGSLEETLDRPTWQFPQGMPLVWWGKPQCNPTRIDSRNGEAESAPASESLKETRGRPAPQLSESVSQKWPDKPELEWWQRGQSDEADIDSRSSKAESVPASRQEPQSGDPERIGPYVLERLLGAGGMGQVYLGLSPGGRHVAIKVIRPDLASDTEFRARFAREVAAARKVSGIYTASVVDADLEGPVPWLATSYVAGPSLAQMVDASGPLPATSLLPLAAGLAEGVAAIHSAGVIHRDIKPSNVLMAEDGPRLVDFGISRSLESDSLTATGVVIGSPGFMSPEQAEGLEVGTPSDIFSLGAVLTFAAAGVGPFGAGATVVQIYRLVHGEPDTSSLPAEIRPLVERCLDKNPRRRPTAAEFLSELSAITAKASPAIHELGLPVPGPPTSTGSRPSAWREPPSLDLSVAAQPAFNGPVVAGASYDPAAAAVPSNGAYEAPPQGSLLNVPMKLSFRYIHEPVSNNEVALPSLGDDALLTELQNRILHSRGGTFLITGFRGVGKSTLVLRTLDQLVARSTSSDLVLPVSLSVARSTTTERLLFAVVRRVFETLSDSGVLNKLPPETRHALLVAYMRTSLSFKETQAEARERSATMGLGAGSEKVARAVTNLVVPNLSISAKRSQSLATEASFLAYSETDVEHDLIRIVSLVDREGGIPIVQQSRLRRFLPWSRHERSRVHLLIILDEVDKLTVDEEGIAAVESLLAGIKNVLTMSGAHFLLVAGPDLHDRAVRDTARGNGIYESVFGWRMYVPCSWDAPDKLIAEMVGEEAQVDKKDLQLLVQYLRFKARGVLRRLLQEFNDFIAWDEESGAPHLRISSEGMKRVRFYAGLEEILRLYFEKGERRRLFPVAIDEDRWRLGSYYVMDWVLRSEGRPFSASELLQENGEHNFDPLLHISRRNVDALLEHFAAHRVVDPIRELGPGATIFGDVPESGAKVYRLAEEVQQALFGFALQHESERPAKNFTLASASNIAPNQVVGKHYILGDLIGQGGMGMVYKATDVTSGQSVAVKMLRASLINDSQGVARLRREAEINKRLRHPQIVRVIDLIEENETIALVVELVEGPTLAQVVGEHGPMNEHATVETGSRLADALQYLADQKVTRIDLKPSNIIMHPRRGPIIIDMGIARSKDLDTLTAAGMVIGSPGYMSPEQVEGRDVGPRADIFVLGIVLYFCLTGKSPFGTGSPAAILYRTVHRRIDVSSLPVSQEVREVIARATALKADERFPDAAELKRALERTPGWRSSDQSAHSPPTIIGVQGKRA